MKKFKALLLAVAIIAVSAVPAAAQFRFGPRVGIDVNELRGGSKIFDKDNRAGFTGGVQAEFTIPVINLGFDVSLMYVHRVTEGKTGDIQDLIYDAVTSKRFRERDYIEIPVNVKYKIGIPVVSNYLAPYVFTGPSFSFLTSKKAITDAYKNRSVDVAWNVGIGVQLISHLHIAASYGIGMTETVKLVTDKLNATPISGKNNYWTITAAWLF